MDFSKDILKNGLRIITAPMPHLKSATAMILVGVGSRYEDEKRQGAAHFIEHMMFKGTKKRPTPLAVSSEMDGIGAVFNAFTSHEVTSFYVKAASDHLPLTLDILTDILLNSQFRKGELERERGVILEERRMYRDDPKDHVWDLYDATAFGNHPLGRPIIGREKTIKEISRRDLLRFCGEWYKPENIIVAVAGKISRRETVDEVRRLLGGLKPEKWSKATPLGDPSQKQPRIKIEERKTDQTHLVLGVRGYPLDHPRKYAYALLDAVLGTGMSSRLFTQVREKRGLAYYVGSQTVSYADTGTFAVYGGVNNQRSDEALRTIMNELHQLSSNLVPQKELAKAKEMLKGNLALGLENTNSVAYFLAYREMLLGKTLTPEEIIKKIDAVTAAEIREVARELFTNENLNLAIIGPNLEENQLQSLLTVH